MIVENGEIQIQNIKTMPDKMILKGSLFWRMAYLKDRQNCTLDHMEGELPFEELVNMDGLTEEARIRVDCEMEDLRVTMIHSRKLAFVLCKNASKDTGHSQYRIQKTFSEWMQTDASDGHLMSVRSLYTKGYNPYTGRNESAWK